ncbi:hypothetical protein GCM10009680_57400 [Streptomyces yatensis]|uniref:Plasmid stabilization protein n=2 Tax=Streptomyces yatensis TaxID=155177 RepID=A0ABN2IP98_9ACTN
MLVMGAEVGGTRLMRSAIINRRPRPTEGAEGEEETMPAGSSRKRERQYEHIKEGAEQRGASTGRAKEMAARTVNKERARTGESKSASKTSTKDPKSAPQRGGQRSGNRTGPKGPTRDQLYNEAKQRGIEGRSNMTKDQLARALGR